MIKPNIILPKNSKDVNFTGEVPGCNNKLNSDDLELAESLEVDGLMEELDCTICLTPPWHNDDNCSIM